MKRVFPLRACGWRCFVAVLLTVVALDQLSKAWVLYGLGMLEQAAPREITSFFSLVLWWNKGVSFSMLGNGAVAPWMLVVSSLLISAVLLHLARKSAVAAERFGYALVVGGALANVIDRLRFGVVADFLYFHIGALGWPAFNIADSAICVGVVFLLIYLLKAPSRS